MQNHQPFYHRVTFLFTAIKEVTQDETLNALRLGFDKDTDIIKESIMVEEFDEPEAGDPADLM